MNIQDSMRIRGDERRTQEPHVSREANEIRFSLGERAKNLLFVRATRWIREVVNCMRGQSELARPREAGSVGPIGDDADDVRIEFVIFDSLMDRGEVRSAAGKKNRQAHYSIQDAKPAGGAS